MTKWYDDDTFWHDTGPIIFTADRVKSAVGEVEAVRELLALPERAAVLDLGCGVGRHSVELARLGYSVTGVDRTAAYIEQAESRARAAGVQLECVHADARSFRREGAFDAVVNLLTSIGYSEDEADDQRIIANVFASLRPDGVFLIDVMPKEVLARIYRERDWQELDNGLMLLEERRVESGWQWLNLRWVLIDGVQRRERCFRLRLYSAVELTAMLRAAGFETIIPYGSLDGRPFDQAAERLVILARRGTSS